MANLDAIIANGTGQTVRTDIESNLQALKGNNNTGTAPSGNTLTSYMSWANTGDGQYMVHNGSAFKPILDISSGTSAGTHIAAPGTSVIPGYRFLNSSGTATQSGMGLPVDGRLGVFMNGTERISLLSDGKVGIGTTSPVDNFHVQGNQTINTTDVDAILNIRASHPQSASAAFIDITADTTYADYGLRIRRNNEVDGNGVTTFNSELVTRGAGQLRFMCQDPGAQIKFITCSDGGTAADRWFIEADGGLKWAGHTGTITSGALSTGQILCSGIRSRQGTAANATVANPYNFYWTGTGLQMWIDGSEQGTLSVSSDYRVKKNITTQTASGIDKIKQLRPVNYEFTDNESLSFKGDGVERVGFIAHEVAEVIPSAVDGEKDAANSVQSLRTIEIVSVLTKALQEAVAKIETLEAKVAALEAS